MRDFWLNFAWLPWRTVPNVAKIGQVRAFHHDLHTQNTLFHFGWMDQKQMDARSQWKLHRWCRMQVVLLDDRDHISGDWIKVQIKSSNGFGRVSIVFQQQGPSNLHPRECGGVAVMYGWSASVFTDNLWIWSTAPLEMQVQQRSTRAAWTSHTLLLRNERMQEFIERGGRSGWERRSWWTGH